MQIMMDARLSTEECDDNAVFDLQTRKVSLVALGETGPFFNLCLAMCVCVCVCERERERERHMNKTY